MKQVYAVHEKLTKLYESLESTFDDCQRDFSIEVKKAQSESANLKEGLKVKEEELARKDLECRTWVGKYETSADEVSELAKKVEKLESSMDLVSKQKRDLMTRVDAETAKASYWEIA